MNFLVFFLRIHQLIYATYTNISISSGNKKIREQYIFCAGYQWIFLGILRNQTYWYNKSFINWIHFRVNQLSPFWLLGRVYERNLKHLTATIDGSHQPEVLCCVRPRMSDSSRWRKRCHSNATAAELQSLCSWVT